LPAILKLLRHSAVNIGLSLPSPIRSSWDDPVFRFQSNGREGHLYAILGHFVLQRGAQVALKITNGTKSYLGATHKYLLKNEMLVDFGDCFVTRYDLAFSSSSRFSGLIAGTDRTGTEGWIMVPPDDEAGDFVPVTVKEWITKTGFKAVPKMK